MKMNKEKIKHLEQQIETLKQDLFLALVILAGEYPKHDDNYKTAKRIAERHCLGDIDPR